MKLHRASRPVLTALVLLHVVLASGQSSRLAQAADWPSLPPNPKSDITNVLSLNGALLITAGHNAVGHEIWRYAPGTQECVLLKDIAPGDHSSEATLFTRVGDRLFFAANDSRHGVEVWVSDGTAEGTRLVKNIGPTGAGSNPALFCAFRGGLLFTANDGVHGNELWYTDGTAPGTLMLIDAHPEAEEWGFTDLPAVLGEIAIMRATLPGARGGLCVTDGTPKGTYLLDVPGLSVEAFRESMVTYNDCVLFVGRTRETGVELWRTDGTLAGTRIVKDIFSGPGEAEPTNFTQLGDYVYFQASDGIHGTELWRSDATAEGTELVADLLPGTGSSKPAPFTVSGNRIFFVATDPEHGRELWVSDGTQEGSALVVDMFPGAADSNPYQITAFQGGVLFSALHPDVGEELWYTDGSPENVRLVADINPGKANAEPYYLHVLDGRVYFEADDGRHGGELWCSDGTAEGTRLLVDFFGPDEPVAASTPRLLTPYEESLYFVARDRRDTWRIWRTDGAPDTTLALSGLLSISTVDDVLAIYPHGDGAYLAMRHAENGWGIYSTGVSRTELKLCAVLAERDGVPMCRPVRAGQSLYFTGEDSEHGAELQRLDMPTGAIALIDLEPGAAGSAPTTLAPWRNGICLSARTADTGEEPWILDGDQPRLLADVRPGPEGSVPAEFTAADEKIYFTANDAEHGREIWCYDETAGRLSLLADINPANHPAAPAPHDLTPVGGSIFFVADDGVHGMELWKIDTETDELSMVTDIMPGVASSAPEELVAFQNKLYFRAETYNNGLQLFVSGGTAKTTHVALDLAIVSEPAQPLHLTPAGDRYLFFVAHVANDPQREIELCWTDGVAKRGRSFSTAVPGNLPRNLTVAGDLLYFTAHRGPMGDELWKIGLAEERHDMNYEVVVDLTRHSSALPVLPDTQRAAE